MGGIGGLPHGGPAALGAFTGHVPDGGNMFIFYGPHVGVSASGEVGAVLRKGHKHCTTSCGALQGVYKNIKNGLTPANYTETDAQAKKVHAIVAARLDEIQESESPEAMLPRVAFDAAHEQVIKITKNIKFHKQGYLVLLGGIQINTPDNMQDQFLPLHFSVQSTSKNGPDGAEIDLTKTFDTAALDKFLAVSFSNKK